MMGTVGSTSHVDFPVLIKLMDFVVEKIPQTPF